MSVEIEDIKHTFLYNFRTKYFSALSCHLLKLYICVSFDNVTSYKKMSRATPGSGWANGMSLGYAPIKPLSIPLISLNYFRIRINLSSSALFSIAKLASGSLFLVL